MDPGQVDFESSPIVQLIKNEPRFASVISAIKTASDAELHNKCPVTGANLLFHVAQRRNDPEALALLTYLIEERGLDPTTTDRNRQNALFYSCRDGNAEATRYLISKGCDVSHVDTALQTALFYGCREGRTDVAKVLVDCGADVNAADHIGQTALFYACRDGRISTVEFLLSKGASASVLDQHKKSASHYALRGGHKDIISLLKNFAASSAIKPIPNNQGLQNRKRYRLQCLAPIETEEIWVFAPTGKISEFEDLFPNLSVWDKTAMTGFVHPASDQFRNRWQSVASDLVNEIVSEEGAKIFSKPVDTKAWGCHDYHEIVSKPMDFSTVKKKLKSYQYASVNDFLEDVDLIFKNCALYNQPETPIGKLGRNLEATFKNLLVRKKFSRWVEHQKTMDSFCSMYNGQSSTKLDPNSPVDSEHTGSKRQRSAHTGIGKNDNDLSNEGGDKEEDEHLFSGSSDGEE